jgi:hypothetical protein
MDDGYAADACCTPTAWDGGWKVRRRKIGFTNQSLWPRYGIERPMWGTVYDRTLIDASEGRARVGLAGLVQVRLEPEVAFGLSAARAQRKARRPARGHRLGGSHGGDRPLPPSRLEDDRGRLRGGQRPARPPRPRPASPMTSIPDLRDRCRPSSSRSSAKARRSPVARGGTCSQPAALARFSRDLLAHQPESETPGARAR